MNVNKDFLLKSKLSAAGFCTTCITNERERYVIILISFDNNYITQLQCVSFLLV